MIITGSKEIADKYNMVYKEFLPNYILMVVEKES